MGGEEGGRQSDNGKYMQQHIMREVIKFGRRRHCHWIDTEEGGREGRSTSGCLNEVIVFGPKSQYQCLSSLTSVQPPAVKALKQ